MGRPRPAVRTTWALYSRSHLAGTLTTLWQFSGRSDGGPAGAGLIQGVDSNFYGTTVAGGTNGSLGTVFKITSAGTLTTLHRFTGASTDGANPSAPLILGNDGNFYGTTYGGGLSGNGVVFQITPGGVYANIYRFTGGADGSNPQAALCRVRTATSMERLPTAERISSATYSS